MPTAILNPERRRLSDICKTLGVQTADQALDDHLTVTRVEIDEERRLVMLRLYGEDRCRVPHNLAESLREYLGAELVEFHIDNSIKSAVLSVLRGSMPLAVRWLVDAEFQKESEHAIRLRLGSRAAEQLFSTGHYHKALKVAVKVVLGRDVLVRLDAGGAPPQPAAPEEFFATLEPVEKPRASTPPTVLRGRRIGNDSVPISSITDEPADVTIRGRVFSVTTRKGKSGPVVAFDITDLTDSISCVCYADKDGNNVEITEGQWVVVRGHVRPDRFTGESVMTVRDLNTCPPPAARKDSAQRKRVEMHLHTKMSAMDGQTDVSAAIERAALWGHEAIAVTDHGVVQAFPEAGEASRKYGVKVIYGVEVYLADTAEEEPAHAVVLARNQQGLQDLYRLISRAHLENFHRVPRTARAWLDEVRTNMIIGSGCQAGELFRHLVTGGDREHAKRIASWYDYLEIQPVGNSMFLVREGRLSVEDVRRINQEIVSLGRELGIPVVAAGDVHYLDPEDQIYRKILLAGQGYQDAESQAELHLRTTDEMLDEFSYLGEDTARWVVVECPRLVASWAEPVLPVPDGAFPPEVPGADSEIRQQARSRALELYGDPLPEIVEERLGRELDAIVSNGFSSIYLIAKRLVEKSISDGYLVGSRGSVGSSLVAYLTGITEVNPLPPHYLCDKCKYTRFFTTAEAGGGFDLPPSTCPRCGASLCRAGHDIPFEVFLGFEGDKVPDIDLNFSGENQAAIHRYAEELLGRDRVYRAGTIATVAERTAYGFVRGFADERGMRLRRAEMERLARGLIGIKRTTGQHPGGLFIVPEGLDITRFSPVQYPADDRKAGTITTHFDYNSIASRLVKLDILGHDDPTSLKMLSELTGVDVRQIPLDDPLTLSLFSSTDALGLLKPLEGVNVGTLGIPEFGTRFVRQMLEETKPKTFSALVRISGLSHGTDVWLNNAQELIKNKTATLESVICTRDDIMLYLISKQVPPKTAFGIMERVRKGKGLTEDDAKLLRDHGVPEWYIESCGKIKYMFPKAHAVAYVTMAFRIAYFKVHYPLAFYATYFSLNLDNFDVWTCLAGPEAVRARIAEVEARGNEAAPKERTVVSVLEVAEEMFARGFSFSGVSLSASDAVRFIPEGNTLTSPFACLPGLGQSAARSIVTARDTAPFISVEDLVQRARLSSSVLELLEQAGCLSGLPRSNQLTMF